jgi:coenzyme F420-dependent glucose-6-phosphate dehydrogenase
VWPEWDVRAEMLEEAVEVIRKLWSGEVISHRGAHYTIRNARIYSLPETLPPIYLAAGGKKSVRQAARIADGLIATAPDADLLKGFEEAGGTGPRYGQVTMCWAESEKEAKRTAREWWPTAAIHGEASQELPNPAHFEQLVEGLTEDQVAEAISCGPDPESHLAKIREYIDAGYDHVYLHQVGPDQAGFLRFTERELLPALKPVHANAR